MAKAVQGDPRAAILVLNMLYRLIEKDAPPEEQDLSAEEQAVLDDFTARIEKKGASQTRGNGAGLGDPGGPSPQTEKPEGAEE